MLYILLLLIFLIFFTIDKKPIHIILDFICIIIIISMYIISNLSIDISLLSYILIIIYGSALAIIFALIVMLYNYNKEHKSYDIISKFNYFNSRQTLFKIIPLKTNKTYLNYLIIIIFIILTIKYIDINSYIDIFNYNLDKNRSIIELLFNYLFNESSSIIYILLIINILFIALIGIINIFI